MTAPQQPKPIGRTDRVSDVLARDESLVGVFVRHARHFEKLRSPTMRRVMARLITVEQAARTAGVDVDDLLRDLNRALGVPTDAPAPAPAETSSDAPSAGTRPAGRPTIELDLRDDMREGREPFSRIMTAVAALDDSRVLRLRTIFEPVPLFEVLARRGFHHESRRDAPEDWSAWFWRTTSEPAAGASEATPERESPAAVKAEEREQVLDVRGLEPPQPMLRTLAALETLPDGHVLVQINSRVPQFLFPVLAERGYACDVDESQAGRIIVRIQRRVHG